MSLVASSLQPDALAPDFSLPDSQGRVHSLGELNPGGLVWLTFFKISCPTCQSSLYFIDRLNRRLAATNARVWTISQDPPDHTRMFNEEFDIELPQLFDAEDAGFPVSDAYGLVYVPTTFLIDSGKRIAQVSVGWDRAEFENMARTFAAAAGISNVTLFDESEHVDENRLGCASKN